MIVCERIPVCRSAVLHRARIVANSAFSFPLKTLRDAEREGPPECAIFEYTAHKMILTFHRVVAVAAACVMCTFNTHPLITKFSISPTHNHILFSGSNGAVLKNFLEDRYVYLYPLMLSCPCALARGKIALNILWMLTCTKMNGQRKDSLSICSETLRTF